MIFARRQMSALAKQGVETYNFFLSSRQSPRIILEELKRFRRAVRSCDPHIVHAHYGTVTAIFCALATLRPLVVSFRGSDLNPTSDYGHLRSLVGRLFSQLSVARAKHVICVSQQLKDRIWLRSRSASIIFDGVDLSVFKPLPQDEARRMLGWSYEKRFVFFNLNGRPTGKRLALAESAIEFARKQIPSIELVSVDKVDPDKIPLFMNACDCLLLTSDWEGSPTVVKEAIACNLPVVTVDVGDVTSLLNGVHPSRVVRPETETLGIALVDVLRLGARSNGTSRADWISEQATTAQILEIYDRVKALSSN
jgi:teichuronic acid biosynthesis glycosyltransferase TuaC